MGQNGSKNEQKARTRRTLDDNVTQGKELADKTEKKDTAATPDAALYVLHNSSQDTLVGLCLRYGLSEQALKKKNGLSDNFLEHLQHVLVPITPTVRKNILAMKTVPSQKPASPVTREPVDENKEQGDEPQTPITTSDRKSYQRNIVLNPKDEAEDEVLYSDTHIILTRSTLTLQGFYFPDYSSYTIPVTTVTDWALTTANYLTDSYIISARLFGPLDTALTTDTPSPASIKVFTLHCSEVGKHIPAGTQLVFTVDDDQHSQVEQLLLNLGKTQQVEETLDEEEERKLRDKLRSEKVQEIEAERLRKKEEQKARQTQQLGGSPTSALADEPVDDGLLDGETGETKREQHTEMTMSTL
eukprot:TRINITY_DN62947_c0_g1_i1.p1 TRINITY_DN62947_c0_g1~~TRINITY_DN62947_c0_g1_i1.p1  ORF type:complete len:370 (-),score=22.60 TRINITY_DN62947_c0_g1_i1:222-1292(-)